MLSRFQKAASRLSHPLPARLRARASQANLLEQIETDGLILSYLYASRLGLFLEELPGLILSSWRIIAVCKYGTEGLRLNSANQIQLSIQFVFSAVMLGFQLCNIKDYIRLAGEQNDQLLKVESAVQEASTELDTFAGVTHGEIATVLRLRGVLGDLVRRVAREVVGDVMLLRYARQFSGSGAEGGGAAADAPAAVDEREVAVTLGATVTESMARRRKVGADAVRERILREDMVRAELACCAAIVPAAVPRPPPQSIG